MINEDWVECTLEEVLARMSNGSSAKQFNDKVGYPISRIETIWNETIDLGRVKYIKENDIKIVEKYGLQKNDILLSHINSDTHLGKTAIIKSNNPILIHGINLLLLRPFKVLKAEFLLYQLRFLKIRGAFLDIASRSVNQSSVNQRKLNGVELTLSPLPIQRAIVSKIETLFSRLDSGIADLKKAQAQLKIYRQAVLKKAFEGELTKEWRAKQKDLYQKVIGDGLNILPLGWQIVNLEELILNIQAGKSFRCEERPPIQNEVGILKVSAVSWDDFQEHKSKTVTDKNKINPDYFVKKDDFLLSRANTIELVGRSVIVKKLTKTLMLSDKTLRISFSDQLDKHYILYYLRTGEGRNQIESLSSGNQVSMRNIGQARIKQIEIPLPQIKEQHQIVQEIESRLSVCDKVEESITTSLAKAEALRQSILKKAFEGKLLSAEEIAACKGEGDYEAASILLERIKGDKATRER